MDINYLAALPPSIFEGSEDIITLQTTSIDNERQSVLLDDKSFQLGSNNEMVDGEVKGMVWRIP